jgi:NADH-quinone oxidoreductase subunit L
MFNLAWLIPILPLLAFVAIVLFLNPYKRASAWTAIGAMFLSFLLSVGVLIEALGKGAHLAQEPFYRYIPWLPTGTTQLALGWMIDPLAAVALVMVSTVCLMIFIYSQGYMHGDPRYSRFFAYVSLFACGMLGLVIANNLLELIVFWETMGLCSYLLIGFWFERPPATPERPSPADAGKKAFIVTRVGDIIFLLGAIYLYAQTGTLQFEEIFKPDVLHALALTTVTLPLLGTLPVATVISLLIFGGAIGKSAQFPLHVWLPDAMEGPTPVSALIHAATMVAAGVYLVARTFPIFAAVEPSTSLVWVAAIGAFTALFAATIGVAQDDIKRVLAYSTISQLGYMIMALGIGGFVAGTFHLITHAFFKALLFLGSGSVIHAMRTNDMLAMGGLRKKMPITFWTFLIGALALAGIPPLAGFWSKDEILADAFAHNQIVWAIGTLAAFLTAFYMGRQIFLTFFGEMRSHPHPIRPPHAGEVEEGVHESPPVMTYPLIVLAFFATVIGFLGVPADFPVLGSLFGGNFFHSFVGEAFEAVPVNFGVMGISIGVALLGFYLAYLVYGREPLVAGQPDPLQALGPIYTLLRNKYYIDELYNATIVRGTVALADFLLKFDDSWVIDPLVDFVGKSIAKLSELNRLFDVYVVDGIVNLVGRAAQWSGGVLRLLQTGRAQNYLLIVFLSLLILAGIYLIR